MKIDYVWAPLQCYESKQISHFVTVNGKLETIASIVTFLFIIMTNVLLLYALHKTRTKNFTSRFFIIISIGDIVMGVTVIPLHLINVYAGDLENCQPLRYGEDQIYILFGTLTASFTQGICIDRYLFIRYPFRYSKVFHEKGALFTGYIAASVSVSLLMLVLNTFDKLAFRFVIVVFVFLIFLTSFFINFLLLIYIRGKAEKMKRLNQTPIHTRYQRKASRTLLMISTVLVVTYFPMMYLFSFAIYWEYNKDHAKVESVKKALIFAKWSRMAVFSNSSVNALIYIWRNVEVRRLYLNMVCTGRFKTKTNSK